MSLDKYIESWDISDGGKTCNDFQNCTNNPLESYNCKINEKLSMPHPSFSIFVMIIEREDLDQVQRLETLG